jgi:hypothetical protein
MAAPNRQPAHDVAVLRTNAFVASRLVPAAGGDHDDIAARSLRERWLHLAITFADRVFGLRLARERYPLNVCIESETRVAGAMSRVSRRGRHLGSGSAKLVSAPTLHRTLRSWLSSMSAPVTPTPPADAPFGTCPRCGAIGPPRVTLVTITLLYFTCAQCGFEWPVRSTYMSRIPPREER